MNIFLIILCLICLVDGIRIVPFTDENPFSGVQNTDTLEDERNFFSFIGATPLDGTSSDLSSTASTTTKPVPVAPTTEAIETVFLVPISDTLFVPVHVSSASSHVAATSNDYPKPPTDTWLQSNLELAEITHPIRPDSIAVYVQNHPMANNLEQQLTTQQMLLTQLHDMGVVNKFEINPATSINNFHVNQQLQQQWSQQRLMKRSEYQHPFKNFNLSSDAATNMNETDLSYQRILANETGQVKNTESTKVVTTASVKEPFDVRLNAATYGYLGKANVTIVKEFLDENGNACIAEQLIFYGKAYFRYICEGELYPVSTTGKSDVDSFNGEANSPSTKPTHS